MDISQSINHSTNNQLINPSNINPSINQLFVFSSFWRVNVHEKRMLVKKTISQSVCESGKSEILAFANLAIGTGQRRWPWQSPKFRFSCFYITKQWILQVETRMKRSMLPFVKSIWMTRILSRACSRINLTKLGHINSYIKKKNKMNVQFKTDCNRTIWAC